MEDRGNLFRLRIIAPEGVFFDGAVHLAEIRTSEGDIGVFRGHIPLTVVLEPGRARIRQGGSIREALLGKGFAEVLPDRVIILTVACEWTGERLNP